MATRLYINGKIIETRRATKQFRCLVCPEPIRPGDEYCCIYIGGGGLGNLKHPVRTHKDCLESYFEKKEKKHESY